VKVFGIVVGVLVLLAVVVIAAGIAGPHGPGRHIPSADADRGALPVGDSENSAAPAGVSR
ncbi:MAG: hypothetical protein WD230_09205, partial [Cucumibacter sp.]